MPYRLLIPNTLQRWHDHSGSPFETLTDALTATQGLDRIWVIIGQHDFPLVFGDATGGLGVNPTQRSLVLEVSTDHLTDHDISNLHELPSDFYEVEYDHGWLFALPEGGEQRLDDACVELALSDQLRLICRVGYSVGCKYLMLHADAPRLPHVAVPHESTVSGQELYDIGSPVPITWGESFTDAELGEPFNPFEDVGEDDGPITGE